MRRSLITRIRTTVAASSFLRFLISGGVNTAATYAVYLILLRFVDYKVAYTIAYVFGIALAFVINRLFVFRTHRGWRSMVMFPFVYLAQYLVSLGVVWAWVERMHLWKEVAPLIAIVITIPMTFLLSRVVFGRTQEA
jgi:putative flippase GtrA